MTDAPPTAGVVLKERAHPASPLVRLWVGVVAVGWALLQEFLPNGDPTPAPDLPLDALVGVPWWTLLLLGVMAGILAIGYWGWWTTWFVIDDRELRVENRGAFAQSKRIAFHRIQSIDISQPFAARILGLAQLTIDAGADEGTRLSYLTRARAAELRDQLMARAHGQQGPVAAASSSAWDDLGAADRVLVRLRPDEIILGALLSGEMVALIIGFGASLAGVTISGAGWVGLVGLLPALALAFAGFLSRRVITQFNYTLAVTPAGLRITRGLTTLKSQTIPADRVQAIRVSQPLVWRTIDRYRLDVTVLGWGDVDGSEGVSGSTVYLPIGSPAQVDTALRALWPGLDLAHPTVQRSPARARWLDPLAYSWNGWAVDDRVIVARQGWFTRRQYVVPHARLQSVRVSQGPLERRAGLADVALHTLNALGDDRILHLDADVARRLAFDEVARSRSARMDGLLAPRSEDSAR